MVQTALSFDHPCVDDLQCVANGIGLEKLNLRQFDVAKFVGALGKCADQLGLRQKYYLLYFTDNSPPTALSSRR